MEASSPGLVSGLRVLDLCTGMGALCGRLLSDLGMDVVKLEPPDGDPLRGEPPFAGGESHREKSIPFAYLNAGKRGITLDLKGPAGRSLFLKLVQKADVVLESFPPGALDALGLGYSALAEGHPKVIMASISGFGQSGPYKDYLAPDLVTVAMGGLLYISGDPGLTPCMPPGAQSYNYGSLCAAYGVMLALWQREDRGVGAHIDLSIQASLALHEHVAFTYASEGKIMRRAGSQHQHAAPANLFPCQDGYISLFVSQGHWAAFLEVWEDHPKELDDPRWNTNADRHANAPWLNSLVAGFTSRYRKAELAELLQKRGLPALPVNSPKDFMEDPHIRERGFFGTVTHPDLGTYQQAGAPFIIDGERPGPLPAPRLGQHNADVYGRLMGLDADAVTALKSEGAI